jgi:hypothetical protein
VVPLQSEFVRHSSQPPETQKRALAGHWLSAVHSTQPRTASHCLPVPHAFAPLVPHTALPPPGPFAPVGDPLMPAVEDPPHAASTPRSASPTET